ncbi:tetratricopeptide repeat protein [Streptomyces sp. NPDC006655]|uniref:tetratricopeptide repeat protein n=1 Tax=Streptomyces sp. NPDC006655 TaxID=3156898 RepID=UPI0034558DA7
MTRTRERNGRLEALIDASGTTHDALARLVNRIGAEAGEPLRYDRSAVAHWIGGAHPKGAVPHYIAEAFARQLHRAVTVADLGFGEAPLPEGRADTVEDVAEIGRAHVDRRQFNRSAAYSLAALSLPHWAEIDERGQLAATHPGSRIGDSDVQAVIDMSDMFSQADDRYGGGHARAAVHAYIAHDVTAFLRSDASEPVRRRMHAAVADLVYLAGFMAWDDEDHILAQRCYLAASRLATRADDPLTYCHALRGLSIQALHLGHPHNALTLAETAYDAGRAHSQPRTRAFLLGQIAAAAASDGNRHLALSHLTETERQLERALSGPTAFGSYHRAALDFQRGQILTFIGDLRGADQAYSASLRNRPEEERRSRAMTLAPLAEIQLRQGHLDKACATWQTFFDEAVQLHSGRVRKAADHAGRLLRVHRDHPAAAATLRRIHDYAATA